MNHIEKTIVLPDGKEIHIETGRLARQADGAAVLRCGDTMLLATVVASPDIDKEKDFLPLMVDYVMKYSASGKIPGGFFKREGRLGEDEILTSRLVDRALRPLFPDDYHGEVQVMIQLLSADREEMPDSLACTAASAALMCSDIPFPDPVSEVRVIRLDGKFIVNPTASQMENADLDLVVAATMDSIVMVEGEMKEVSEETMLEAFKVAHEAIKVLNQGQLELRKEVGKTIREYEVLQILPEVDALVREMGTEVISKMAHSFAGKEERSQILKDLKESIKAALDEKFKDNEEVEALGTQFSYAFKNLQKEIVRNMTLETGKRLDGRTTTEIRDIWSAVGYLPRAHGSAIFTRGETQSLCSVTLGTKLDAQTIDSAIAEQSKRFYLHYNFPGFSTGEVRFLRGAGRREIGHGNLAERALKMVMPADYEYVVRVISDILESNGSSSMASVCGGCLSLMDAGVPLSAPVSGIAMGLITDDAGGRFAVLSDILGDEDFLGDMDFKVAGTAAGLTACQMDIKIRGLSYEILQTALEQSKAGRAHILGKMNETLSEPRPDLSPYAPRIIRLEIPSDMIGAVIGPGGKIIQEIQKTTNTVIVLEEIGNIGQVTISSVDELGMKKAEEMIKQIVAIPEVGAVYRAKVKSIKDFGAFVEFMPGREGLLHISEIEYRRLPSMEGVLEIGDEFDIKLIGVDERTGKFRLSRKVLLPKPEGWVDEPPQREGGGGGRGERGGDNRGGRNGGNRGDRNRGERNRNDRG
ncbi:MAG: polyribonucleotide nucleotidyltransferase [Bacteroidia bacterium]|nr:polyribonucleotide nucleotidyltransferase [Bacteroidia bacterium]